MWLYHRVLYFCCPCQILRSLNKTYQVLKKKPMWVDLNPKAVTPNELFGSINPATREWKDGMYVCTPATHTVYTVGFIVGTSCTCWCV